MDLATFHSLVLACAPLVHPGTAQALVAIESGFNPHAIGVVGGALERQPRNEAEALATARMLQAAGWDYSLGLAQINVRNVVRLGLDRRSVFDPCKNLSAMQDVLRDCYARTLPGTAPQQALRQALSCYYSGNFSTGFEHGYVRRVVDAAAASRPAR